MSGMDRLTSDMEEAFRRHLAANPYASDLIKRIAFEVVPMARRASQAVPAPQQAVAWIHEVHYEEGCGSSKKLTFDAQHPFGIAGVDYSPEYKITSTPLHAASMEGCEYCVEGLQADGETPCPCTEVVMDPKKAEDKTWNEALEKAIAIARRCGAFATARDIRKLIRTVEE